MRTRTSIALLMFFALVGGIGSLASQSPATSADAPTFDAAVVKPHTQNAGERRAGFQPGGRFVGENVSLGMMIGAAFSTPDAMLPGFQMSGDPDWMNRDGFDVDAKAPGDTAPDRLRQMLRSLLEQRFKLVTHVETRDLPTYSMVLLRADGRLGAQLQRSSGACIYGGAANPNGLPHCEERFGPAKLKARRVSAPNVTLDVLAQRLSSQVGRRVVNRTGVAGSFDVDLEFNYVTPPLTAAPDQAPDGLSLFAAIEDQLGLRLSADRGPVDILVIDHAEHPVGD